MLPAKRRRLDVASTLTKPFRSPLSAERKLQQSANNSGNAIGTGCIHATSSSSSPVIAKSEDQVTNAHSPIHPSSASLSSPLSRPFKLSRPNTAIKTPSPTRKSSDPEYITLQKQHSRLALQLKHLTTSLDTTSQALKILDSDVDRDLERLIQKWRNASREAAEELFQVARTRVDRMGGVSVWRERYQRNSNDNHNNTFTGNSNPWGDDSIDEDDLTEEQREQLDIVREEARREAEKYGLLDEPKPVVKEEKENDSFTIDMMLKQLNVDFEVIGYDLQAQRWT